MKYIVGYLGSNEYIRQALGKHFNSKEGQKAELIDLLTATEEQIEATSFNGIIYDTSEHNIPEHEDIITEIIKSNPDIDIMPIISETRTSPGLDELDELEKEADIISDEYESSAIPFFVDSEREAELFMKTIYSTLSSKTLRHIKQLDRYIMNSHANLLKTLKKIVITLEMKDPYTKDHSYRVSNYAKQIAIKLGLPEEQVKEIAEAGWLHDLGKLAISDDVLLKPGKLDDDEFMHMRSHAALGETLLNNLFEESEFANIKSYARHHHERFDGRGYPDKIGRDDIPLGARILCLSDSFDAMTTKRSYNNPRKLEDAIFDIQSNSGKQFDPNVAEAFIELLRQEPEVLRETLGISVDKEGYIMVEHSPKSAKKSISNTLPNRDNEDILP